MLDSEAAEELMKDAVDRWGIEAQLFQAMEEMAELIHALSKWRRHGEEYREWVIEEMIDVKIMLSQISYMLMVTDEEEKKMFDKKITKLEKKLK